MNNFIIKNGVLLHYEGDEKILKIPTGVKEIKTGALKTRGFEEVILPEGLEIIGDRCFVDCWHLKKIKIPTSVKVIKSCAFAKSGLMEITLPEGLRRIDHQAFWRCKNLSKVDIPTTVNYLEATAFQNSSVEKLTLKGTVFIYMTDIWGEEYRGPQISAPRMHWDSTRDYNVMKSTVWEWMEQEQKQNNAPWLKKPYLSYIEKNKNELLVDAIKDEKKIKMLSNYCNIDDEKLIDYLIKKAQEDKAVGVVSILMNLKRMSMEQKDLFSLED